MTTKTMPVTEFEWTDAARALLTVAVMAKGDEVTAAAAAGKALDDLKEAGAPDAPALVDALVKINTGALEQVDPHDMARLVALGLVSIKPALATPRRRSAMAPVVVMADDGAGA